MPAPTGDTFAPSNRNLLLQMRRSDPLGGARPTGPRGPVRFTVWAIDTQQPIARGHSRGNDVLFEGAHSLDGEELDEITYRVKRCAGIAVSSVMSPMIQRNL